MLDSYDDWKLQAPPCDGPEPCPRCLGRGSVLVLVREWHSEAHGFDGEDDERECVDCSGTGVR